MRALIADDEAVSRRLLEATLMGLGYDVTSVEDGGRAWELLRVETEVQLAVLDWMMPGMDGIEVCRRLRQRASPYVYVILLTARDRTEDVVIGLDAGADDYVTKPFDPQELRSRLRAGERIVRLESTLASKVRELEQALAHVRRLEGLLPICMHCKRIRDASDAWQRIEDFIEEHSDASFTHSLCATCAAEHYPEIAAKSMRRG